MEYTTLLAHERLLVAAPNKQQFIRGGR